MITILYPYRNRELSRIKNSLDSLVIQSNKNFSVVFVDYGSDTEISSSVKELLLHYKFVKYVYSYHQYQPWSRSKAVNIGLRYVITDYVFIADIDIIFHNSFVQTLYDLKNDEQSIYFQVGYLSEHESKIIKNFEDYVIESKSIPEGQGLSLFKLENLLKVSGFDEFFHFWGAEDEDVHLRLQNAGLSSKFYDSKILLLHQWHETFENLEKNKLAVQPILSDVFSLNKQKLRFNQRNKLIAVNGSNWGKVITEHEFQFLNSDQNSIILSNKKHIIENFVDIVLPNSNMINVIFKEDSYAFSNKYKIKKFLGIKTQEYYSLKKINDLILKDIIVYYRDDLFFYGVSSDLKSIQFKLKKYSKL